MHTKNYIGNSAEIGVYRILNTVNNKAYIGSTKRSFHSRKTKHLTGLRTGTHFNSHLQKAYNKYGEDSFVFEVMLICDESECVAKESLYIDAFKTFDRLFGYNSAPVSPYKHGYNLAPEHVEAKSNLKKEKALSVTAFESTEHGLPTPINVYNLDGKLIKSFNSQRDACVELNISASHLCNFLKGRKLKIKDYIIIYANDTLTEDDIIGVQSKKKKTVDLYEIIITYKKIGTFSSADECSDEIGCSPAEVRMCCTGKRTRIGNYYTEYSK